MFQSIHICRFLIIWTVLNYCLSFPHTLIASLLNPNTYSSTQTHTQIQTVFCVKFCIKQKVTNHYFFSSHRANRKDTHGINKKCNIRTNWRPWWISYDGKRISLQWVFKALLKQLPRSFSSTTDLWKWWSHFTNRLEHIGGNVWLKWKLWPALSQ